jgi:hypothetical protein
LGGAVAVSGERSEGKGISAARRLALRKSFAALPQNYEERYELLRELRREFHRGLAVAIQPALREHVRGQPKAELQDRLALTAALAESLEALGLTLSDSSGRPALLVVDVRGDPTAPGYGQYRLEVQDPSEHPRPIESSDTLPELHIVEADSMSGPSRFRWRRGNGRGGPER